MSYSINAAVDSAIDLTITGCKKTDVMFDKSVDVLYYIYDFPIAPLKNDKTADPDKTTIKDYVFLWSLATYLNLKLLNNYKNIRSIIADTTSWIILPSDYDDYESEYEYSSSTEDEFLPDEEICDFDNNGVESVNVDDNMIGKIMSLPTCPVEVQHMTQCEGVQFDTSSKIYDDTIDFDTGYVEGFDTPFDNAFDAAEQYDKRTEDEFDAPDMTWWTQVDDSSSDSYDVNIYDPELYKEMFTDSSDDGVAQRTDTVVEQRMLPPVEPIVKPRHDENAVPLSKSNVAPLYYGKRTSVTNTSNTQTNEAAKRFVNFVFPTY